MRTSILFALALGTGTLLWIAGRLQEKARWARHHAAADRLRIKGSDGSFILALDDGSFSMYRPQCSVL